MSNLAYNPDAELKSRFAEELLRRPDDPFKAALAIFPLPQDTGKALLAANVWVNDPFVKSEKIRFLDENGSKAYLPNKDDQLRDIWKLASDANLTPEDRIKAHRLYAEIQGNIEKPNANASTTNILNQGVMIVRDQGSDEDWEARAIQQQRTLTGHATAN